jgi:hypothetical protein
MINPPSSHTKEIGFIWIEWLSKFWHWMANKYIKSGTVSLATGTTTTTVVNNACQSTSRIFMMPADSGSSSGFGSSLVYISAVVNGSFTITHSNSGSTRTFYYLIVNN